MDECRNAYMVTTAESSPAALAARLKRSDWLVSCQGSPVGFVSNGAVLGRPAAATRSLAASATLIGLARYATGLATFGLPLNETGIDRRGPSFPSSKS